MAKKDHSSPFIRVVCAGLELRCQGEEMLSEYKFPLGTDLDSSRDACCAHSDRRNSPFAQVSVEARYFANEEALSRS